MVKRWLPRTIWVYDPIELSYHSLDLSGDRIKTKTPTTLSSKCISVREQKLSESWATKGNKDEFIQSWSSQRHTENPHLKIGRAGLLNPLETRLVPNLGQKVLACWQRLEKKAQQQSLPTNVGDIEKLLNQLSIGLVHFTSDLVISQTKPYNKADLSYYVILDSWQKRSFRRGHALSYISEVTSYSEMITHTRLYLQLSYFLSSTNSCDVTLWKTSLSISKYHQIHFWVCFLTNLFRDGWK